MDNRTKIETPSAPQETPVITSGPRPDTVKLVEMGNASVETKGMVRGLEVGLTPKS